jgi:hypothetical protein
MKVYSAMDLNRIPFIVTFPYTPDELAMQEFAKAQ